MECHRKQVSLWFQNFTKFVFLYYSYHTFHTKTLCLEQFKMWNINRTRVLESITNYSYVLWCICYSSDFMGKTQICLKTEVIMKNFTAATWHNMIPG